jgi:hypothetical protein
MIDINDNDIRNIIQQHYLNMRDAIKVGLNGHLVQKSFEELLGSVTLTDSWRPTHISRLAVKTLTDQSIHYVLRTKQIRRAHGQVMGRIERYDRTIEILTGQCEPFEAWWPFFLEHDKTILITRTEHNDKVVFDINNMIELPPWNECLFENGSKSIKIRKNAEISWLMENRNKLM